MSLNSGGYGRRRGVWWIGGLALLGIAFWGAWSWSSRPRPNVLLITLDTTRADRLGCYGDLRLLGSGRLGLGGGCSRCLFSRCRSLLLCWCLGCRLWRGGCFGLRRGSRRGLVVPVIEEPSQCAGSCYGKPRDRHPLGFVQHENLPHPGLPQPTPRHGNCRSTIRNTQLPSGGRTINLHLDRLFFGGNEGLTSSNAKNHMELK